MFVYVKGKQVLRFVENIFKILFLSVDLRLRNYLVDIYFLVELKYVLYFGDIFKKFNY